MPDTGQHNLCSHSMIPSWWWICVLRKREMPHTVIYNKPLNKIPGSVSRSRLTFFMLIGLFLIVQIWFEQRISTKFFRDGWKFVHSRHPANVQWLSPAADVRSATCHLNDYWPFGYDVGLFFYTLIKSGAELQYTTIRIGSISIKNLYRLDWIWFVFYIAVQYVQTLQLSPKKKQNPETKHSET